MDIHLSTFGQLYPSKTFKNQCSVGKLSQSLGLTHRQLQLWWANRRLKDRKTEGSAVSPPPPPDTDISVPPSPPPPTPDTGISVSPSPPPPPKTDNSLSPLPPPETDNSAWALPAFTLDELIRLMRKRMGKNIMLVKIMLVFHQVFMFIWNFGITMFTGVILLILGEFLFSSKPWLQKIIAEQKRAEWRDMASERDLKLIKDELVEIKEKLPRCFLGLCWYKEKANP